MITSIFAKGNNTMCIISLLYISEKVQFSSNSFPKKELWLQGYVTKALHSLDLLFSDRPR
jgi:hypothetical protein